MAQTTPVFPTKPIRIVVALAPGGGVDTTGRAIAQRFTEAWGQQAIVENRPGAGGTIAAEVVARAAPDGHTLLVNSAGHTISPNFYPKLPYDPYNDFTPVALVVSSPNIWVVHPSLPVRNVKELIALARARPDELLFSSSGSGGPQHLALELFKKMTGLRITHVPYKGTSPSITDLIGGRVSMSAGSIVSTIPHHKAGRLRAIATSHPRRAQALPDLPTVAESGVPGYAVETWYGAFTPANTPRPIVQKLYEEIRRAVLQPEAKERLLLVGLEAVASAPSEFTPFVRAELDRWGKLIRELGIRAE